MAQIPRTNKRTQSSSLRRIIVGVGVGVVLVVALLFGMHFKGQYEARRALADMKNYLDNKYGQSFVVENYRIEGGGFAVEGDPTADAYPEMNTDVRFTVWDYGDYKAGSRLFRDNYLSRLWSREFTNELEPKLRQALHQELDYTVDLGLDGDAAQKINYRNGVPSLNEYRMSAGGKGLSVELVLLDRSILQDAARLWKLIAVMKNENTGRLSLRVCDRSYGNCHNLNKDVVEGIDSLPDAELYIHNLKEGVL